MYMANASPNARGPNTTYIPPAIIGLALGPWELTLGQGGFALGLGGLRWVCEAFQIPGWYRQHTLLALGAAPNAKPQCE